MKTDSTHPGGVSLHDAAKAALADLQGIMPEFEPSGERLHPAWKTIDELTTALQQAADSAVGTGRTEPRDLTVENALLRSSLWLAARALRDYHDAPHFEIDDDGITKLEVIVPETLRPRAADALARAEKMLKEPGQERSR